MTCLWQHKNATQHDLGSKKPIFFNCLLDGAHTKEGRRLVLLYLEKVLHANVEISVEEE